MSDSIGSSAAAGVASGYLSRAALHAEVAQFKKQLSDCVNCPTTSSTPEGKAAIQELSSKINVDQNRIREIEAAEAAANSPSAQAVKPTGAASSYTDVGAPETFTDSSKGSLLNAFA